MDYLQQLTEIGIRLLEPLRQVKKHHKIQCIKCTYEWTATPISKIQAYKKFGSNGCPSCYKDRVSLSTDQSRKNNLQQIRDRGLEIISNWDGRNAVGANCVPLPVEVRNTVCGHSFTSNAVNLLRRGVTCPICAKQYKTNILNANSERRSNAWKRTAPEWKLYRSEVTSLTRIVYKEHKHIINPLSLPKGRAGTPGAYHLDHIVSVRYCFENKIPAEICAHHTNLQMLPWVDNIVKRDHLPENVPVIFEQYIRT